MEISKKFIDQMLECNWLCRCGNEDDLGFDVEYINSQNKMKKMINSIKWENACLEADGDFTAFLHKNHKEIYNKFWNETVRMVKNEYINNIADYLEEVLSDYINKDEIICDIKANLVTLFMIDFFSEYYSSDFYEKMLKIYLSGHLPCGWAGTYPEGKFVVF